MLTALQQKKVTLLFHFWDYDKSGALERKDYAAVGERMAAERGWAPGSPEYVYLNQKLMEDWEEAQRFADTNNDNKISLDEWLVFCDHFINDEAMYQVTVTNIAGAIIEAVDGDGDGRIVPAEWATVFRVYGWQDETTALETFRLLDRDGDGLVTKEELLATLDDFFMSDDPNEPSNFMFGPLD